MKKRKFKSMEDFFTRGLWFVIKLFIGEKRKQEILFNKKCKRVRRYGREILEAFDTIAHSHNVKYSLMFGTLLGAYRDKGFIMHDDDIDIAVDINTISFEFIKNMCNNGFEILHICVSDMKDCVHFAFEKNNVKFDLYSYNVTNQQVLLSDPIPDSELYYSTKKQEIDRVKFDFRGFSKDNSLGKDISIFSNPDEILQILYGANFMTPQKGAKGASSDKRYREPLDKTYFNLIKKRGAMAIVSEPIIFYDVIGIRN